MQKLNPPKDAWRMASFYALTCAVTGVSLPFISPWFKAHGLTGAEIGVVLGAPMLARLVTGPLIAVWADSFKLRRTPIAILCLATVAAYLAIGFSRGLAAWLALWFVGATALGATGPLIDVMSLRRARKEGFTFAWPRGVGSATFVIANVIMGWLLTRQSSDAVASDGRSTDVVLVWITAAAAATALAAAFALPREPVDDAGPVSRAERFQGLGRLVGDPLFMTAILSVSLIQAGHAFYYGFSSLIWKAAGLPDTVVGLLWGTGVVAEIVFLWFLEPWRRRMGPWRMLMISGVGAVVRWTALAFAPPLWLLWPLQLLHGLTFAACYIAGLQIVERLSPPQAHSAGQTLNSALSGGVLIGLATIASGALYDRYGAYGYLAMSVMALAGLAGALRLRPALRAQG
jgi:PPP family 3-phenylpropionic acid transporter